MSNEREIAEKILEDNMSEMYMKYIEQAPRVADEPLFKNWIIDTMIEYSEKKKEADFQSYVEWNEFLGNTYRIQFIGLEKKSRWQKLLDVFK